MNSEQYRNALEEQEKQRKKNLTTKKMRCKCGRRIIVSRTFRPDRDDFCSEWTVGYEQSRKNWLNLNRNSFNSNYEVPLGKQI